MRLITMGRDGKWHSLDIGKLYHDEFQLGRYFHDDSKPAGLWGIVDDTTGACLLNRVVSGPLDVYYSKWNKKKNVVTLEIWSKEIMLKRGEKISIEYEYELLPGLPRLEI